MCSGRCRTEDKDEFFESVDLTSGNVVGDFANRNEALVALQRTVERHGWGTIANLSLLRIEDDQSLVALREQFTNLVEEFGRSTSAAATGW